MTVKSKDFYSKYNPFYASIKERKLLSGEGSKKKTQKLIFDLAGSGLTYEVGDSVGVYPRHDPYLIKKTLKAAQATGEEPISLKGEKELVSFFDCLSAKINVTTISLKLLKAVSENQTNLQKKQMLFDLMEEEKKEDLKEYLQKHEMWDFLLAHEEVTFTPQELVDLSMPLLPRFYSIASSQNYVGEEVHLILAPVTYDSNGHPRHGVCTHYLSQLVPFNQFEVPIFIQPSHGFHLPSDPSIPLIMIGPGTGIAPFRAFLQERIHQKAKGKNWLFFGEWHRQTEFFYEEEWMREVQKENLILDLAFSRDQAEKIYVQNKMWQKGEEIYRWLNEEQASLYVCGDAKKMAKDVEAMLLAIIQKFGAFDLIEARDYIKQLRQQKRYLRDVY